MSCSLMNLRMGTWVSNWTKLSNLLVTFIKRQLILLALVLMGSYFVSGQLLIMLLIPLDPNISYYNPIKVFWSNLKISNSMTK